MALRRACLNAYVGAIILGGIVGLGWSLRQWGTLDLGAWELALFIGLASILDVMVVPVAGGGAVAASFAVYFAGLITLGAEPTVWVATLAVFWSEGVVRRRPLVRVAFNASHSVLSLLGVGWIYKNLGGEVGRVDLSLGPNLLAVVVAAMSLWLLETAWVTIAVKLEKGGGLRRRLSSALGPALAWDGALASVGLLLALLYQSRWYLVGESSWQGTLVLGGTVLIPSGLLFYAYRLQGSLQEVYSQSLRTLGSLLEAKVEGGQPGHGERVAKLAARLAEHLELPPAQIEQIRYAGYLHDIGKVGVPSSLLNRDRDRFCGEPEALRLHAQIGASILSPVRFLQPAAEMVKAHHERWDGLGYPRGLRQRDIPLGARVLALADAYIGMTHSAQPTLSPEQAIRRLRQASTSRFDPVVVGETLDSLIRVIDHKGETTASPPADQGHLSRVNRDQALAS